MPAPRTRPATTDEPGDAEEERPVDTNEVSLEGTLSADAELRSLPSGDVLVELRVVCRRPDGARVDSLPVIVGPGPEAGRRRSAGQASRATVDRAAKLTTGERVVVSGWIQRRFWATPGGRRTRLQVVATEVRRA